jgi:predicted site-specific integrase-resolvase
MKMWLTTTKLAKLEGVTSQTIRRHIEEGKYDEVKRTKNGHFRVYIKQKEKVIIYARVSSGKQKSSLECQVERLRQHYPNAEIITDIASSFNFKRKGIETLLEYALYGIAVKFVATNRDRVARSGFEIIKKIVESSGGNIELLDEETDSEETCFNTTELIAFITSFCNSYYGKRSAKIRRTDKTKNKSKSQNISSE